MACTALIALACTTPQPAQSGQHDAGRGAEARGSFDAGRLADAGPGLHFGTDGAVERDAGVEADLPPLTTEAERAARLIRTAFPFGKTSRVSFIGPVAASTAYAEPLGFASDDGRPSTLSIPVEAGSYYLFFIDDAPDALFSHRVRYAWADLESASSQALDAKFWPELTEPGVEPAPFELLGHGSLDGVAFTHGRGGSIGEVQDVSHKPQVDGLAVHEEEAVATNKSRGCEKWALMVNGGDKHQPWFFGQADWGVAEEGSQSTDRVAGLMEPGTHITRISQYWGDGYRRLGVDSAKCMAQAQLTAEVGAFGRFFDNLGCGTNCCHDFTLFVQGHGGIRGVGIFDPSGSGRAETVPYGAFYTMLQHLPDCVSITLFISSCYSGNAIQGQMASINALRASRKSPCTLRVITATDVRSEAPSTGSEAPLEIFANANDADHDGNGKAGEFDDRVREMVEKGKAAGYNPQTDP